ncbi:MAG: hypothetical protein ABII25_08430 [bacterium]
MGQNLNIRLRFYFVLITLIFIMMSADTFSISYDRNPHDREFACNECHGVKSKYGQPETEKHKDHLDENNITRFSNFQNESYKDLKDKNGNFITRLDLCDECHYDKDVDTNIKNHMDGTIQVALSNFDPVSRSCSSVNCHLPILKKAIQNGGQVPVLIPLILF